MARVSDERLAAIHAERPRLVIQDDEFQRLAMDLTDCRAELDEAHKNIGKWRSDFDRVAAELAETKRRLDTIQRPCVIRRGHEVEDLLAHGPEALCSTRFIADLYEQRVEAERRLAEAVALLREWEDPPKMDTPNRWFARRMAFLASLKEQSHDAK